MPKLTIRSGPQSGAEFSLDKNVVIGRGAEADLSLNDGTVSRRHAMFSWVNERCTITDLNSENGTYVNAARISRPTRLRDGDKLHLGTLLADYTQKLATPAPSPEDSAVHLIDETPSKPHVLMTMVPERPGTDQFKASEGKEMLLAMSQRIRFLTGLGKVVSQTFDETAMMSFVLKALLDLLPQAERAFIMFWEGESGQFVPKGALTRSGEPSEIEASRTLLKDVIQSREGVMIIDASGDQRYDEVQSLRTSKIRTAICVPIIFQENTYGVIQVDSARLGKSFRKSDMSLMLGIASQVGMSLA